MVIKIDKNLKVYDYLFLNFGLFVFYYLSKHLPEILKRKEYYKVKHYIDNIISEVLEKGKVFD